MGAPEGNKNALGSDGGAPSKYTPELIAKARAYLKDFKKKHKHEIPSVVGLANVTGIPRNTFYFWIKKSKEPDRKDDDLLHEIVTILDQVNELQELTLMNNGLNGTFNSNITKLALGKHGYHDKQDTDLSASINVNIDGKDADTF